MAVRVLKPNEIKSQRALYGMFQKDLARETGLSTKDVSRSERGIGSMKTLSVISLYFQQRQEKEENHDDT